MRLETCPTVSERINQFLETNDIPHIIFHGSSGTGKRSIVYNFINRIYQTDKTKIKANVLFVNCAQGKGIKFIRDELKFFAKKNIQISTGVKFKSIVLLDADYLTIDAQSALRRCIEQFSHNTRFFIVVENKHKLLNPILSRFCEIFIPEQMIDGRIINLHQHELSEIFDMTYQKNEKEYYMSKHIPVKGVHPQPTQSDLTYLAEEMYFEGISCLDLIEYLTNSDTWDKSLTAKWNLRFMSIKSEYRCEPLLMVVILNMMWE